MEYRDCPKRKNFLPVPICRAGIHTCRWWNGLPKDSADRDIRPTKFMNPADRDIRPTNFMDPADREFKDFARDI